MIGGGDRLPVRGRLVLADGATGALTAQDGTIDWWCPGRVDAPPLLWGLLDRRGAALRVGPVGRSRSEQSYLAGTLLARTVHTTARGAVEVVDVLPLEDRPRPPALLRFVNVLRGEVDLEVHVRVGKGWRPSTRWDVFDGGVAFEGWILRSPDFTFERDEQGGRAVRRLRNGDRAVVSLTRLQDPELAERDAHELFERTASHWRRVGGSTLYGGAFAAAVHRSVQVLHGLPSRSLTTSLAVPGREDLALDARHRWVSDTASAALVLDELGLHEDARAAHDWLRPVVQRPLVPVAVVDAGEATACEGLTGLDGFGGGPVLIGIDVGRALGVDGPAAAPNIGTSLDALGGLAPLIDALARTDERPLRRLAEAAAATTPNRLPGLVRQWAYLDAIAAHAVRRNPLDLDAAAWREASRAGARTLTEQLATSDDDDPRLLRLAWQAPLPSTHELVVRTVDRVLQRRGDGPFIHGDELGSTAASWWAVRALALLGRWEEAHDRAERLVAWAGDAAILPRSVEGATRRFAGDLPDATAHLALLTAAQTLGAGPA